MNYQQPAESHAEAEPLAFGVLVDAVTQLRERRKVPTAAGVRSEMTRLTASGFSHEALGYERFRDFLAAAEGSGRVLLTRPEPGSQADIEVSLPGEQLATRLPKSRVREVPLPGEVWKAFVSWSPGLRRVVERATGQVFTFPAEGLALEPHSIASLRSRVEASPPGEFVDIEPIDRQLHEQWAGEFISEGGLSSEAADVLRAALGSDKPLGAFASAIRGFENENEAWTAYRLRKVRQYISQWSAAREVRVSIDSPEPSAERERRPHGVMARPSREERLLPAADQPRAGDPRQIVIAAIEQMTLSELLELRIPARILLTRDGRRPV